MSPTPRLSPGDPAPDFTLSDDTGAEVSLSDLRGEQVIVYFYPERDDARAARRRPATSATRSTRSRRQGYRVLGISPNEPEKLAKFRERDGLTITLLSDPDRTGAGRRTAPSARRSSTARSSRA